MQTIKHFLLTMLMALVSVGSANALTIDGVHYSIYQNEATVAGCAADLCGDVVIPDVIYNDGKSYPVKGIEKEAFWRREISSVIIGDNVQSIGANAFCNCEKLKSVVLGKSVKSLRFAFSNCSVLKTVTFGGSEEDLEGAFYRCYNLQEAELPNSVTEINRAFVDCISLEKVDLGTSIEKIGYSAFEGCSSLQHIKFPNSLKEIEYAAFSGCTELEEISFSESVRIIGKSAFAGCNSLKELEIPSSVQEIKDFAFGDCKGLKSVRFSDEFGGNLVLGSSFGGCSNLETVYLGNSISEIGQQAFSYCSSLKNLNLGKSLKVIGPFAFLNCKSLEAVEIPASVSTVGGNSFVDCQNLKTMVFVDKDSETDNPNGMEIERCIVSGSDMYAEKTYFNESLTTLYIGNSVTRIKDQAFWSAFGLVSLRIADSVTEIGKLAFFSCKNLNEIFSMNPNPPAIENNTFSQVPKDKCTLIVPSEALERYKAADYWGEFFNIRSLEDYSGVQPVVVDGQKADGKVYNLSGQRVGENYKGIVIKNGKKINL